jgi:hypothetical protein
MQIEEFGRAGAFSLLKKSDFDGAIRPGVFSY